MAATFDISLDSLAGRSVSPENVSAGHPSAASHRNGATFFLEPFGCQMNDHDSEKVAGVLLSPRHRQVESPHAPSRGYVTISEGCDKACAYCVVPFTRGPERSRASDSVLKEVREIAELGYSEVQLLGQTVNSYADPSSRRMRFSELLLGVADVPGIRRVRFTTSHPRDFQPETISAIQPHP